MTKEQIISLNNSLGFDTKFFNENNGFIGYNEGGVIYLNECYPEDLVMANQHELLHNFENTKSFKFMQRAIIGFLKDEITELRREYTLRYAGVYSPAEIKNGYLDTEIAIDFIIGNGNFKKNIKDIFPNAFDDIVKQNKKVSTNKKYLTLNLSNKIEQQFPELSTWEKLFVINYYNGKDKILPTNKQTKYEDVRQDINKELNRLYNFANSFLNFRIDAHNNPEVERHYEGEINAFIARGDNFTANHHKTNKKDALETIADTISQQLHQEYKHIVDYIKSTSYEPAFKALMLNETLVKTYRQITVDGQQKNIVEKRDLKKSIKGHMTLNETTLRVIYNNLKDYSNFANLYFAGINVFNNVISQKSGVKIDDLNTFNMGKWIKFEGKTSNEKEYIKNAQNLASLVQSTPWCTKSLASTHLSQGDFYVFVDNQNQPHIAVKMNGNEIDEVRGLKNGSSQELEEDYRKVALEFLDKNKDIKHGKEWLEKEEWNKRLIKYKEMLSSAPLSPDLYTKFANDINADDYKSHGGNSNLRDVLIATYKDKNLFNYVQNLPEEKFSNAKEKIEKYEWYANVNEFDEQIQSGKVLSFDENDKLFNLIYKTNLTSTHQNHASYKTITNNYIYTPEFRNFLTQKFNCNQEDILMYVNTTLTPRQEPIYILGEIVESYHIANVKPRFVSGTISCTATLDEECLSQCERIGELNLNEPSLLQKPKYLNLDNLQSANILSLNNESISIPCLPKLENARILNLCNTSAPNLKIVSDKLTIESPEMVDPIKLNFDNLEKVETLNAEMIEIECFPKLKKSRNINLYYSTIKSLPSLEIVENNCTLACTPIEDLSKLKIVKGRLSLKKCKNIKNLDSLEYVGRLDLTKSSVSSMKNLKEIKDQLLIDDNHPLKEFFEKEFEKNQDGVGYHRKPEYLPKPENENSLQV